MLNHQAASENQVQRHKPDKGASFHGVEQVTVNAGEGGRPALP